NDVPNGTTGKDGLQTRLDQIDSVTAPEINDQDSNGVLDTAQLSEAEQAIAAVEKAKQAADNKLSEITADNLINPSEKAELDKLKLSEAEQAIAAVEQAKKVAANKLSEITSDNLVNTSEKAELDQLIEALETAKTDALTKLNNVPNGTTGKAELQTRLDQIGT